ncbi:MAG: DUF2069 domain-containing protein, partial [Gammaproteobacteria bacterium]|nr:DUF2069 domain-containing protein [Gammaproteobacteria bacterium]
SGSLNNYLMLIWMFPLIFPLKGLIKGRPYTFAWSGFLAILYITHGLTCVVTHPQEMPAIILELIFSSLFLFGGMYYVRWKSKL